MKLSKSLKRVKKNARHVWRLAAIFAAAAQLAAVNALATSVDVQARITEATNAIQGILTGIVVGVGICVSLFIILTRMPDSSNPHEKHELFRGVGRVWGLVALAGACVWVVPWFFGLLGM